MQGFCQTNNIEFARIYQARGVIMIYAQSAFTRVEFKSPSAQYIYSYPFFLLLAAGRGKCLQKDLFSFIHKQPFMGKGESIDVEFALSPTSSGRW